ncbi:polysaccharide deacetylase family protein [Dactylosporangium sp. CA-092794]|uniref:polysaccharide deacetylase family protein n=1 Tax=Dactylosporangium sp. CA-092794 TaxID=3239929 RepID=UPI003D8E4AC3
MLASARARRLARIVAAAAALTIAIAACDDKAGGRSHNGAAPAMSAPASAAPSASAGDDAGVPADDGSPQPSASHSSSSPTPSKGPTTSPPPPGHAYAGRLPKFGRPPAPHRVNLPEGASAAYYARIPTDQPVAFLTIDDGWIKRPEALELLRESDVQVTLFLTINAIKDNPGYFKQLRDAGADIEAHTLTHPNLKGKSYDFQKHEICGSADQLAQLYGKRPTLFRPPFGDKDATTLKVAHDCGLHAGFFWKETVDKGIVRYQEGHAIKPGDIILMHFRDRFVDDFIAALQAISAAGLTPALLVDYMPAT